MTPFIQALPDNSVENQRTAAEPVTESWFIVTQVKCNRIVYFTSDPTYHPPMDGDWYFITHHVGSLPAGMTLANCWGWRFNGGTFADAREAVAPEPHEALLESNRRALLSLLKQKVDQVRTPWSATCAMGDVVRRSKLDEAKRYLASTAADTPGDAFELLRSVATAQRITMPEAAELIVSRDREMSHALVHSEQVREHYTRVIRAASTPEELMQIRRDLLNEHWQAPIKATPVSPPMNPVNWHAPLDPLQRANEVAHLQTLLRQIINRRRSRAHSDYVGHALLLQHKASLARQVLSGHARTDDTDHRLLESYATARRLNIEDAARLMLGTADEAQQILVRTEILKDRMLARIEGIETLSDVRDVALELDTLVKAPSADEGQDA
jgi:hypothetical protein